MGRRTIRGRPWVLALAGTLLLPGLAAATLAGELHACVLVRDEVNGARVSDCILTGTRVSNAFVERVEMNRGSVDNSTVQAASILGTRIESSFVTKATLVAADVSGATLTDVTVRHSALRAVYVTRALVADSTITDSTIDESTFERVQALRVRLCRVHVVGEDGSVQRVDSGCPEEAWPREGSVVHYVVHSAAGFHESTTWDVSIRLEHRDGAWTGECVGSAEFHARSGDDFVEFFDESVSFEPMALPVPTAQGVQVADDGGAPAAILRCGPHLLRDLVARVESTVIRNGVPTTVWYADNLGEPRDCRSWANFDAGTGLVLAWSTGCDSHVEISTGRLVWTDAPLG